MATTWPSITWTAPKSNSWRASVLVAGIAMVTIAVQAEVARGCPFCTALEPTLAQRRAAAAVTLLAEVETTATGGPATLRVHQVLSGKSTLDVESRLTAPIDLAAARGTLVVLFGGDSLGRESLSGTAGGAQRPWHAVAVDEVSAAYLARSPAADLPASQRLVYFARYLEHPNRLIAQDAYLEFGHAPFDVVAEVGPQLSMSKVRAWLVDPAVPGDRKGFYGLVLGLAAGLPAREANTALLRRLMLDGEDDFRAGFDGILGGYLLLADQAALEQIEARYLANPTAAVGDVRHAQTALRFYHEYGRVIPKPRICEAMQLLLARPEFAASAIIDLARWNDWRPLERIAALYGRANAGELEVRRAVVGYLLSCPEPQAQRALAELRAIDPDGVSRTEQLLSQTGSLPQGQ